MPSIIKTENLSYVYSVYEDAPNGTQTIKKTVPALNNVSLEIEEGSFVAVLGHNGSGKSTLAKLLDMILMPTSGRVYIDGTDITSPTLTENDLYMLRRNIGMVFQNPDNQIVATVVEEDVAFGPENLGMEPDMIKKRVGEALFRVGMSDYARHATTKLSGGQKQRVAIAGILAMRPRCVIFDESTAMLDPMGRREVMDIIESLNRIEKKTVITITHYMSEATRADRVIVMRHGGIYMDGTPKEIFSRVDELWEVGLDVPQTAELLFGLRKMGVDVPTGVFDVTECANEIAKAYRTMVKTRTR